MMIQLTIINAFKMSEAKFWEKKKIGRKSKKKKEEEEDINRNLRTETIHPMNELNCRI